MKLNKPVFDELKLHFQTKPESVHHCSRVVARKGLHRDICTSAVRMCEALVLANRMVSSRAEIATLTNSGGDGRGFLLGRFGYRASLCPHGLGRGARDVADFLSEQWGRPTFEHEGIDLSPRPEDADAQQLSASQQIEQQLQGRIGLLGFFAIEGVPAQGHLDLWDQHHAIGKAPWRCRHVVFWKLD